MMMSSTSPILSLHGIHKQYPGVKALDDVDFTLEAGEVHVLFGENGAGKSTLISIISGANRATDGEIRFRNQPVNFKSVFDARSNGISAVFQEFSLVDTLSIAQNLFLGEEPLKSGFLDTSSLQQKAKSLLKRMGFDLDPDVLVGELSRAEKQMVEIAKALRGELSVLILDEPTASLTNKETEQLFDLIAQIKQQGVGIIYISHRMAEIRQIADRITVLRDGRHIGTKACEEVEEQELITMMTGRVVDQIYPDIPFSPRETVLEVREMSTRDGNLNTLSFHARAGEVVGFAGLVGCGKSEALRACFGLEPVSSGFVVFQGENVTNLSTRAMLDRGFFYNSRDRKAEGLVMIRSCRENMSLAAIRTPQFSSSTGALSIAHEQAQTEHLATKLKLYPNKTERDVGQFSGGNQQKVLLAKCLTRDVSLYVFDEPTVGVDVGTRAEIYRFIASLCEQGAAVVIISSDLPEVVHLSHRLYIMREGKIEAHLQGDEITEPNALSHFFESMPSQNEELLHEH
ncbi:putative ABC-type monosaccharide transport system, ATPase component [Vibrio nigripulchritudo SFn27]|uniref:Putative ABC-type monosaccharide transport system, ATPase component n=1 Tax=Vibrio nigripulchritudo TaxID=28173 RepID=U4KCD4_9VIBR|nr:sugar ABC transporter ATP-binding protein [Vibrio nigripulchritudo]CCN81264.1 putative ABC-type monosaccharide transport system, ATPase component [Vibrio nigripulchritudo BLFn1]CCN86587.1 putative ABC-type monosaccharide transport system, ATPase component [Vibrio nigripulchritudo SFn27]CCN97166.1 putative ABC-type monosaccharide transport system, ATPase component [Vibrio nigripulchritudo ENn2]CCO43001.1 putative ABC-type monosaccharide transport system, ATPase component [Vibrio nigripulchrit